MRSFCSNNSRSRSATRLAVAPGDPRERPKPPGEGTSKTASPSIRGEERSEATDSAGLVERAASGPGVTREPDRARRLGLAGSAGAGGADLPRDRLGRPAGGTTPNETICAVVSGLTAFSA